VHANLLDIRWQRGEIACVTTAIQKKAAVKEKSTSGHTPKASRRRLYGGEAAILIARDAQPSQTLAQIPGPKSAARADVEESDLARRLLSEVADGGFDVDDLCKAYGLKREELGRLTGFSLRALAEWSAGKIPSQPARRRLQEVRRLLDALAKIVKPKVIPRWLHAPNAGFDGLTPLQVIELGEIDRLWVMVHDLQSGAPE